MFNPIYYLWLSFLVSSVITIFKFLYNIYNKKITETLQERKVLFLILLSITILQNLTGFYSIEYIACTIISYILLSVYVENGKIKCNPLITPRLLVLFN